MIGKLANSIEKESFVKSLNQRLSEHEHIILDLFVSNACNLHCNHCYFLDYSPIGVPISFQRWSEIIDESINMGIKHFHFSGREPFCDKRVPLLLEKMNNLSANQPLKYGLVTNGTLLTNEYFEMLTKSRISYIEFSLEGDVLFNSTVRGTESYNSVFNLIKNISDKSKVSITSTYFGNNLSSIERMMDQFIKIGVSKFNIAPYLFFDKKSLSPVKEIDYKEMIKLVHFFYCYLENKKKNEHVDIRISVTNRQAYDMFTRNNELSSKIAKYIFEGKKMIFKIERNILEIHYPLLYVPYLSQIVITNDGLIIPCANDIHYSQLEEISLGNIVDNGMDAIMKKRLSFISNYINQKLNQYEKN